MKNSKLLMLSTLSFIMMQSCSEGDNGDHGFSSAELVGTWDLVEIRLSEGVDMDGNGTLSSNLLNEADCISGAIVLKDDTTYQFEQTSFKITANADSQYNADCYGTYLVTGAWASNGSEVAFQGSDVLGTLQLMGNRIIKSEDEALPGVETYIYEKR